MLDENPGGTKVTRVHESMKMLCLLMFLSVSLVYAVAGDSNVVHVALVFDDGPFPEHAPKLLVLFAKEKIHVTFSLVASNVLTHPDTAKAILAGGHEVANHSYSHQHAKDLDDTTLEHEIVGAQKIINEVT